MEKIDLHLHTTYSDGALDIEALLCEAKRKKLKTVAITDHETIYGLAGYEKAKNKYNMEIIPGIEMNVSYPGMHILGYGINDFKRVENVFDNIKIKNEQVVYDTIRLLQKNGIFIELDDVIDTTKEYHQKKKEILEVNSSIFKYDKKFILTKTDIARTLVKLGYVKNVDDAYKRLIGSNTVNYIRTDKIDTRGAIELVLECGGVPVLAHPMTVNIRHTNLNTVCKQLKDYGLEGIEALGPRFKRKQIEQYTILAKKLKLLTTAGSDFHTPGQVMGLSVSPKIVYSLKNSIKNCK